MAKSVIYKGKTQVLGHFGTVKTGQRIVLTEREWHTCRNNPEFALAEKPNESPVELTDTPHFRFTALPWGTPNIFRVVHRKGRDQLRCMAEGLASLGLPCVLSSDMPRETMADVVLEAAGVAGWL